LLPCKDSNLDFSDPESDVLTNYTTGQFSKDLLYFKKHAKVKRILVISKCIIQKNKKSAIQRGKKEGKLYLATPIN
jgi:hypothetical protein